GEEPANAALALASKYVNEKPDAVDKVNEVFASIELSMNYVKSRARTQKLEELIQEYVRQNPDAVIEIQELLADTGLSMDALLANALSERREYLDHIERAGRARRRGCRIQSDRTSPAQRKRCCLTSERKVRANRENARASTGP